MMESREGTSSATVTTFSEAASSPNTSVIARVPSGTALAAGTAVKEKMKTRGWKRGGPSGKSPGKISAGFKTGRQGLWANDFAASVSFPEDDR